MSLNFPIAFEKMNGTGNDFVVIDNRNNGIPQDQQPRFAKEICKRMYSIGADGLILLQHSASADFSWNFYNADGSEAEMCGNGARCAARFAYNHGICGKKMQFETVAGLISAEICNDQGVVKVGMLDPQDFRMGLSLRLDDTEYPLFFVNTGVPHAVILVEREEIPVKKWGRTVRFHQLFEPKGTNATFVQVLGDNRIRSRSYERGVEDETQACGTGAVASALFAAIFKGMQQPVEVITSGGDTLTISFDLEDGPRARNVYLQGPTRIVCRGEILPEALL
ncbi:MAG: diaminopimelate epimerase [Deltaproteobacteria bacterium]|nr:MAG: diaminopimelate epimerase [Deltaproteobacteria bacterium]